MSRLIPEEEYGKRPMGALRQWMSGVRDPYLNNVEAKEKTGQGEESEEQLEEYQI